jgi:hypothetical protein
LAQQFLKREDAAAGDFHVRAAFAVAGFGAVESIFEVSFHGLIIRLNEMRPHPSRECQAGVRPSNDRRPSGELKVTGQKVGHVLLPTAGVAGFNIREDGKGSPVGMAVAVAILGGQDGDRGDAVVSKE